MTPGRHIQALPGATGDCGDEAGLGIGAEENGSSGAPLKAEVIWVHRELMLSPSPSTSGTEDNEQESTMSLLIVDGGSSC